MDTGSDWYSLSQPVLFLCESSSTILLNCHYLTHISVVVVLYNVESTYLRTDYLARVMILLGIAMSKENGKAGLETPRYYVCRRIDRSP